MPWLFIFNFHFQAHLGLKESPTTSSEDTVLSWEPGNEAKTTLLKQPIEILSNLSKQPIEDLNLFRIYTQNQNQLHNMKIRLHKLVGHRTDYLISCSTAVLFAARPPTRLMSSQRVTCLDPVPCRAPLPFVQCTHYNLWCHHIKLGELSKTYPTMRAQKKKWLQCWSAFSN